MLLLACFVAACSAALNPVQFVAVGSSSTPNTATVASSPDGAVWTYSSWAGFATGRAACFSSDLGVWLIGGQPSGPGGISMATSADGSTWVPVVNSTRLFDQRMWDCDWGVDRFVATGRSSLVRRLEPEGVLDAH